MDVEISEAQNAHSAPPAVVGQEELIESEEEPESNSSNDIELDELDHRGKKKTKIAGGGNSARVNVRLRDVSQFEEWKKKIYPHFRLVQGSDGDHRVICDTCLVRSANRMTIYFFFKSLSNGILFLLCLMLFQKYRRRPNPSEPFHGRSAIATEAGSSSVRSDALSEHVKSPQHQKAHVWAFPHETIVKPPISQSEVGKQLVDAAFKDMTFQQLVARFKLIHTLVMEKVGYSKVFSRSVSF